MREEKDTAEKGLGILTDFDGSRALYDPFASFIPSSSRTRRYTAQKTFFDLVDVSPFARMQGSICFIFLQIIFSHAYFYTRA